MSWKAIGHSATGTSHTAAGKGCEDAVQYATITDSRGRPVLVCCAADGAGSALQAAWASAYVTRRVLALATAQLATQPELTETHIYAMAEALYDGLQQEADAHGLPLNEYSCTLLGCIISPATAIFFQVGDGAIVRSDGSGYYLPVWWPHNGEYQNSTAFLIDDSSFGQLQVAIIEEQVDEVAIFTDGLQMLTLNMESHSVHQPFFHDLFRYLRQATDEDKIAVLDRKLAAYLDSNTINDRTDDDKTLFMATRLPA